MNCCKPMAYAIENGYLKELYSYTDGKERYTLGVYAVPPTLKIPPIRLDMCPWCGHKLPNAEGEPAMHPKWIPVSTKPDYQGTVLVTDGRALSTSHWNSASGTWANTRTIEGSLVEEPTHWMDITTLTEILGVNSEVLWRIVMPTD